MFELEDNDNLANAWAKVFMLCVPQLDMDFLVEEMKPKISPFHSLKEKLNYRILSGEMLLEMCCVYGQRIYEKQPKLLGLTYSTWEDINWKIRKLGANRIRRIIPQSLELFSENEEFYAVIVEKLEELMTDEENFVKIDAFETIVHSLQYFKPEDVQQKFIPRIKEVIEKEVVEHEEFLYPMASFWGELNFTLHQQGVQDWLDQEILDFYESCLGHESEEIRKRAAFNLPYFFTKFYDCDEESKDVGIPQAKWIKHIKRLLNDSFSEIRTTVAAGFHILCEKVVDCQKELGEYKSMIYELLDDDNEHIMTSMVKNLKQYVEMFRTESGDDKDEIGSTTSEEIKEISIFDPKSADVSKPGKNAVW